MTAPFGPPASTPSATGPDGWAGSSRELVVAPSLLVVGAGVVDAGMAETVVAIAERHRVGVLNSFLAKGLFPFDHPAHLGTIGLQRDDVVLAGVNDVLAAGGTVVVSGAGELADMLPLEVANVSPSALGGLRWPQGRTWPSRPALYERLAAVCGPAYGDDTTPLSPIRAAGDLAGWLPGGTVVVAGAGLAGFWLARTFPTRSATSIMLPSSADPAFIPVAVEALVDSGLRVVVVADASSGGAADVVGGWRGVVIERWLDHGPLCRPAARLAALQAAVDRGGGDLSVGVRLGALDEVVAVAGPVVAWGGVPGA